MKILSPATSANLGPGFDSLGLAIKLYNEITITEQSFSQISISGEGANNSMLKKNNSFVNIFNSTLSELGLKGKNFRFDFKRNSTFSWAWFKFSYYHLSDFCCL